MLRGFQVFKISYPKVPKVIRGGCNKLPLSYKVISYILPNIDLLVLSFFIHTQTSVNLN
jgi:hypothetical protein